MAPEMAAEERDRSATMMQLFGRRFFSLIDCTLSLIGFACLLLYTSNETRDGCEDRLKSF